MPNRLLKESICTSEDIEALSTFAENMFYRLIVNCDDYGRMDARPAILKSRLYPLKDVRENQIVKALEEMELAGVVLKYTVEKKPYLQLPSWGRHQRIRNSKEKYPGPDQADEKELAASCGELRQVAASCGLNPIQSESNPNPNQNPKARAQARGDDFFGHNFSSPLRGKLLEWLEYKKERRQKYTPTGQKSLMAQVENRLKEHSEADIIELIGESMANGWQGIIWDKLKKRDFQGRASPSQLGGALERSYAPGELEAKIKDPLEEFMEEQEGRNDV